MKFEVANSKALKADFRIFDALIYREKPDLSLWGFEDVTLLNHVHLWGEKEDRKCVPKRNQIAEALKKIGSTNIVIVNVEHWPLDEDDKFKINKKKYKNTIAIVKQESKKKIGIYSIFPKRDYWATQSAIEEKLYLNWQNENNKLKHIVEDADIVMPSLYTFYRNIDGWVKYAKSNIFEAKRVFPHKPIYVFLWPQFHYSSKWYGGDFIDAKFWKKQLEISYKYADGIIIWGGWDDKKKCHIKWSENWGWWHQTKIFNSKIKLKKNEN